MIVLRETCSFSRDLAKREMRREQRHQPELGRRQSRNRTAAELRHPIDFFLKLSACLPRTPSSGRASWIVLASASSAPAPSASRSVTYARASSRRVCTESHGTASVRRRVTRRAAVRCLRASSHCRCEAERVRRLQARSRSRDSPGAAPPRRSRAPRARASCRDVVVARRRDQRALAQSDDARFVRPSPRRFVDRLPRIASAFSSSPSSEYAEPCRAAPKVATDCRARAPTRAVSASEASDRRRRGTSPSAAPRSTDGPNRVSTRLRRLLRSAASSQRSARRAAVQCVDAAADHSHLREALESASCRRSGAASSRPSRHVRCCTRAARCCSGSVPPARGRPQHRVLERGLEVAPSLVPVGGAAVQNRNQLGLALDEFAPEQLPEQVVIAVPLSASVERDSNRFQRSILSSSRAEPARRARHRTASRTSDRARPCGGGSASGWSTRPCRRKSPERLQARYRPRRWSSRMPAPRTMRCWRRLWRFPRWRQRS